MNYKLPEFDLSKFKKVTVGGRVRFATATAVNFITENLILVAVFLEKKIYLIDLENLIIIHEVSTINYPDLMHYKEGLIVTSERTEKEKFGSVGVYTLSDNKIKHKKNIDLENFNELHGIRILNEDEILITNKSHNKGILILNPKTNDIISFTKLNELLCDIFLLQDKILVLTTDTKPNQRGINKYEIKTSRLYLYDFPSYNELSKISFSGQVDCVSYENGFGFVTIQSNDSLLYFKIVDNILIEINEIKSNFSFPHGVDFKFGKVCVTNYGSNSVDIFDYKKLIEK